jgi:hypothetical protein
MLGPADITEISDGLWRWTERHPEWSAGAKPESTSYWPSEVGSVAYAAPDALVLFDPLVPDGADALWGWLDERAAERPRVAVLTTLQFHRRSRDAVVARYGASTSRARGQLPEGVEALPIRRAGETMFWLPQERTLIPGDRLLGDGRGGLRLCPQSWIDYLPREFGLSELREALRPLLDLPIERVLVSHWAPVLRGGREAVARAIEAR